MSGKVSFMRKSYPRKTGPAQTHPRGFPTLPLVVEIRGWHRWIGRSPKRVEREITSKSQRPSEKKLTKFHLHGGFHTISLS